MQASITMNLIDKVSTEEAIQIREIISFFENNPSITKENVDTSHRMLIKFNELMQNYTDSDNVSMSFHLLCIHQKKWDSDVFCKHPNEHNKNSVMHMRYVTFADKNEKITRLEKGREKVEQILQKHLNSRPFLIRILSKIKLLFK